MQVSPPPRPSVGQQHAHLVQNVQGQQEQAAPPSRQRKRKRDANKALPGECTFKESSVQRDSKGRFSSPSSQQECGRGPHKGELPKEAASPGNAADTSDASKSTGITVTVMDAATGAVTQHVYQRATQLGLSCQPVKRMGPAAGHQAMRPQEEASREPAHQTGPTAKECSASVEQPGQALAGIDQAAPGYMAGTTTPQALQGGQQAAAITSASTLQQTLPRQARHEGLSMD
jgi:hypothetical protein